MLLKRQPHVAGHALRRRRGRGARLLAVLLIPQRHGALHDVRRRAEQQQSHGAHDACRGAVRKPVGRVRGERGGGGARGPHRRRTRRRPRRAAAHPRGRTPAGRAAPSRAAHRHRRCRPQTQPCTAARGARETHGRRQRRACRRAARSGSFGKSGRGQGRRLRDAAAAAAETHRRSVSSALVLRRASTSVSGGSGVSGAASGRMHAHARVLWAVPPAAAARWRWTQLAFFISLSGATPVRARCARLVCPPASSFRRSVATPPAAAAKYTQTHPYPRSAPPLMRPSSWPSGPPWRSPR